MITMTGCQILTTVLIIDLKNIPTIQVINTRQDFDQENKLLIKFSRSIFFCKKTLITM